tara:strand:+ start:2430 stop:2996 length:567 start_codon:yes stop_codon:yes gene_type:complete
MTFRKVLKWPDKSLKKKSVLASLKDVAIVEDLLDTFRVIGGYGLSAPQIGFQKRVIVINELALTGVDGSQEEKVLVNPEIVNSSELVSFEEACFSIDSTVLKIERHKKIKVSYTSLDGKKDTLEAEGYHAACIQHEIDHLDGILMIDRLSPLKRNMFLKKQKKVKLRKKRLKENLRKEEPRPGFRKKK